jgi:hypothetical protein
MIVQTLVMMWTGWMVTKIACRRRKRRNRRENG